MCFKNLEGKSERENPKSTIFVSGGLGLLHFTRLFPSLKKGRREMEKELLDYLPATSMNVKLKAKHITKEFLKSHKN